MHQDRYAIRDNVRVTTEEAGKGLCLLNKARDEQLLQNIGKRRYAQDRDYELLGLWVVLGMIGLTCFGTVFYYHSDTIAKVLGL